MTPPTREPEVIAKARKHVAASSRWGSDGSVVFLQEDDTYWRLGDVLRAYDAIVAERDAAVSMLNQWKDKYLAEAAHHDKTRTAWGREMAEMTRRAMSDGQEYGELLVEHERLKARLAACKRDLNYIRRVTVGAVESDKLAATCKTIGEYRYVLLKAINAMDIAAVAAETQTNTEDTDR